ncbi:hypothetical protein [Sphingomonas edaphi]|nr:hypothetical protein [Sphingomonas edaphi]
MKRPISDSDLPPTQAALSAALRRAFAPPVNGANDEFEALLKKLG